MSPSFVGTCIRRSSLSVSSCPSWGGTLRLHHTPDRRGSASLCSLVMFQQRYRQPSKCWGRQRWWSGVGSNLHGFGIEWFFCLFVFFLFVVNYVIHWNEKALSSHVFPIPIPPPTSLPTRSLQVLPEHQVRVLVSCIQPGLVICFTLDNIHVSMLFSWNIPPSPSPRV